jgi:hypothetical protein
LRVFAAIGTCTTDGACDYAGSSETCQLGCDPDAGRCNIGPP